MAFKSILSPVIVENASPSRVAADFAAGLAAMNDARLLIMIAAPPVVLQGAFVLPAVRSMIADANAQILRHAHAFRDGVRAIEGGVTVDCEIVAERYLEARERIIAAARMSDLIVLTPVADLMETRYDIMRAILFETGRPVLLVPARWEKAPAFRKIVVAWDGGASAARALGDAMAFIEQADQVEIVRVTPDSRTKSADVAALGAHLSRHCRSVQVNELPLRDGDVGKTIREHASLTRADLVVMGAFGHSRLWETMLGGVTRDALEHVATPTLVSH